MHCYYCNLKISVEELDFHLEAKCLPYEGKGLAPSEVIAIVTEDMNKRRGLS